MFQSNWATLKPHKYLCEHQQITQIRVGFSMPKNLFLTGQCWKPVKTSLFMSKIVKNLLAVMKSMFLNVMCLIMSKTKAFFIHIYKCLCTLYSYVLVVCWSCVYKTSRTPDDIGLYLYRWTVITETEYRRMCGKFIETISQWDVLWCCNVLGLSPLFRDDANHYLQCIV